MLEDAIPASTTAKRVAKDGDEVLAHCEKHSNDPVELAGLCKLFFFHYLSSHVCCLSTN